MSCIHARNVFSSDLATFALNLYKTPQNLDLVALTQGYIPLNAELRLHLYDYTPFLKRSLTLTQG